MTARHSRGPRLFLSDVRFSFGESEQKTVTLTSKDSHYIRDVLRLTPGDPIEVADPTSGILGQGLITSAQELVTITIDHFIEPTKDGCNSLTILAALCKGDKNDRIVDWATELGCSSILFWQSLRSIVRLRDDRECAHKTERLSAIALAAAQQSKQQKPPSVSVHRTLNSALAAIGGGQKFICSMKPIATKIQEITLHAPPAQIILAIGPEGDFAPEEYTCLTDTHNFAPISLGQSTLRAELAVVTAITAVRLLRG